VSSQILMSSSRKKIMGVNDAASKTDPKNAQVLVSSLSYVLGSGLVKAGVC